MTNVKSQTEILMNELLSFAEKMLADHDGFHPFGGYLDLSARVVHVGVQPDAGRIGPSEKVEMLIDSFHTLAAQEKAIAFAITTDVSLPYDNGSKGDAIKFFLEHRDCYCAEVFFRYMKSASGKLEITDTIAQQGEPIFFGNKVNKGAGN